MISQEGDGFERLGRRLVVVSQVVIGMLIAIAIVKAGRTLPIASCDELRRNMDRWGFVAPLIYVALYTWATICFIPGSLLTMAAGVVFGVWEGCLWSLAGSTLGATIAFFCGRFLAADMVRRLWGGMAWFQSFERHAERDGFVWLLSVRLSPVMPFTVINYVAGVVPVRFSQYFIATVVGVIPGKMAFLFAGSTVGCAMLDKDGLSASMWSDLALPLILLTVISLLPLYARYRLKRTV